MRANGRAVLSDEDRAVGKRAFTRLRMLVAPAEGGLYGLTQQQKHRHSLAQFLTALDFADDAWLYISLQHPFGRGSALTKTIERGFALQAEDKAAA